MSCEALGERGVRHTSWSPGSRHGSGGAVHATCPHGGARQGSVVPDSSPGLRGQLCDPDKLTCEVRAWLVGKFN